LESAEVLELAKKIVEILDEKKALDIQTLAVGDKTILADYFIIAGGSSTTQVRALADELSVRMSQNYGVRPSRTEGIQSANWILLDYNSVIVHIFHRETREFYNLEKLWSEGSEIPTSVLGELQI